MADTVIPFDVINAWKQMTSLKMINEVRTEIAIYFKYRCGINYFLGFKMEEDDNGNLSDEAYLFRDHVTNKMLEYIKNNFGDECYNQVKNCL